MEKSVTQFTYHESGIFSNGHIKSFRDSNEREKTYTKSNKACTLYDGDYRGECWTNNFKELITDSEVEIYSVVNSKGETLSIGDWIKPEQRFTDIFGHKQIKITSFYIASKEIRYRAVTIVDSGGTI